MALPARPPLAQFCFAVRSRYCVDQVHGISFATTATFYLTAYTPKHTIESFEPPGNSEKSTIPYAPLAFFAAISFATVPNSFAAACRIPMRALATGVAPILSSHFSQFR